MFVPDEAILRASKWCYRGVWAVVTRWFYVPAEPPRLRGADDRSIRSFRPARGFLSYLRFFFWLKLAILDGAAAVGWLVLLFVNPRLGLLLSPLVWAIIILPDIAIYIAIHLRYDTTWYVLSDRSMRIRRGIWVINETTITYDNIQNVAIRQGPLQRYFGIADVIVETAGGGASTGKGEGATVQGHSGLLEGIDDAAEVRNLILSKWRESGTAGLGDEAASVAPAPAREIALLEEIRDLAVALAFPSR